MQYQEIINFLEKHTGISKENCAIERFQITKLAFEKIKCEIAPSKVIIVAGTNGKGTTSMTLAHLLAQIPNNHVGLYTSPHLISVNERIKYACNGVFNDISNDDFVEAFNYVHALGIELSHFEYLTLMAVYYFFIKHSVDYAIFEVGLGGKYDATNVIPHNTCIITKLGMDHEKYLGYTIESIAENKFGIINNSKHASQTVIHTEFPNENVNKIAANINAKFIKACNFQMQVQNNDFYVCTKYGTAKLALPGLRACENTALALTAFNTLGYNPALYLSTIKDVKWPGRMETVYIHGQKTMLSGDHNEQGIDSLIEILKHYKYQNVHFIVGIAIDKHYDIMLEKLLGIPNSHVYLTETPYKTRYIDDYGIYKKRCTAYSTDWKKLWLTIPKSAGDLIVITGSLYLIGKVKMEANV